MQMNERDAPGVLGSNEGLGPTLALLNKEMPCNPPWGAGQYVSVYAVHKLLSVERERREELEQRLREIGDFAHDHSTGPAVPDALWEVRSMAYGA